MTEATRSAVLYATDLDQTLIYSRRAAGLDPDFTRPQVAIERYQDRSVSFVTDASIVLLDKMWAICSVVPVTTRTLEQYRRVTLFDPPRVPEWAVATNGGHLLHRGEVDQAWNRSVHRSMAASGDDLAAIVEWVARQAAPWIDRVREADGLFAFARVDRDGFPESAENDLRLALADRGWIVSVQGRKLYAVPKILSKASAVAEVKARLGASTVMAAGDSLLDADMLRAADVALRPAHGELHEIGEPADIVSANPGIAAGEELLRSALHLLSTVAARRGSGPTGEP